MDGVIDPRLYPSWMTRPMRKYWAGPTWQPIPSTFRNCEWCGDHLPVFGPQSVRLGDGYAHKECADRTERFALKSSIRHRTNPTTGYFQGWETP